MSIHKVPLTTITDIIPHGNADSLEVAIVYGFQVVVRKGTYSIGLPVVYIPIDSVIPAKLEGELFPEGSKIKLSKSRIKQIRIRGRASQGMLLHPSDVQKVYGFTPDELEKDYSVELSISKFEPPEPEFSGVGFAAKKIKREENPHFDKYNGLENIKWFNDFFKEGEEVVFQEKVHGCLNSQTEIEFIDGTRKTIKEIVDNKIQGEIWGVDIKTNKIIPTKITNWFNNGKSDEWLNIKFTVKNMAKGNYYRTIICTPNHKFFNPITKEYIAAKNLKPNDDVMCFRTDYTLNWIQEQTLIGKMLGDGSLSHRHMTFGHKKEFESYLDYTLKFLGDIAGNKQKDQISGYGTHMCKGRTQALHSIQDLFEDWIVTGEKQVPSSIIGKLSPISLAFWYMDDGSLSHHEDQQDRAYFAVCAFNDESVNNLIQALKCMGINGVSYKSSNQDKSKEHNRIRLNADEAEKMFIIIAPYIAECMKYKLPERYRTIQTSDIINLVNEYKPKLVPQKIIEIEKFNKKRRLDKTKYDIETETHNFIADKIVVHNSNVRASISPYVPRTLFEKVKKLLGLLPEFQECYGSNNVQLQDKPGHKGYYGTDIYGATLKNIKVFEKLKPNEQIFGELYGDGIQKNYRYGCGKGEHKIVLFDVKIDGKFLSPDEVRLFAKERGFDVVPELYRGPFSKQILQKFVDGPSVMPGAKEIREGVVIKPIDNKGQKRYLKAISEKYLDKEQSDFH